jgi:N-acetylglucosamine repressor
LNGKLFARDLSFRVGADCLLVHDTHALCLAEYVYGQAGDLDSFVVLDMSTGIGMGAMGNSVLLTGHSGFAGEMGHIPVVANGSLCRCGRRGCLETVASEWALMDRVSKRLGRPIEFDELLALARNGDELVRTELNRVCKYLAMALATVVNLFDPQCVFINGRMFDALPWLREHLVNEARPLALEPAFADCRFLPASGTHLLGAVATGISAVTASRIHELYDTLNGITFSVTRRSVS